MSATHGKRAAPGPGAAKYRIQKKRRGPRQQEYHSSSEDEDEQPQEELPRKGSAKKVTFAKDTRPESPAAEEEKSEQSGSDEAHDDVLEEAEESSASDDDDDSGSDADDGFASQLKRPRKKRNDPTVFATSISKILDSKLTSTQRSDPLLARSKEAQQATKEISESRLEARAKHKLREEKKAALEKGRIKDVLGLDSTNQSTQKIVEEERRLRKTAQRGVVKLFNAFKAAQMSAMQAEREARRGGVVGTDKKEELVTEMSKKGFLDLIAGGGSREKIGAT